MEVRLTNTPLPTVEAFRLAPLGIGRGNVPAEHRRRCLSMGVSRALPSCMGSSWGCGTGGLEQDSDEELEDEDVRGTAST